MGVKTSERSGMCHILPEEGWEKKAERRLGGRTTYGGGAWGLPIERVRGTQAHRVVATTSEVEKKKKRNDGQRSRRGTDQKARAVEREANTGEGKRARGAVLPELGVGGVSGRGHVWPGIKGTKSTSDFFPNQQGWTNNIRTNQRSRNSNLYIGKRRGKATRRR